MVTLERIKRAMDRAGHLPKEAMQLMGLSLPLWYRWRDPKRGFNPLRETMEKIEEYLGKYERRRK